jgi:hypothetical protein
VKSITVDLRRVASRKLDDETTVIDLRGRVVHQLNATATQLWDLVVAGRAYDDLVRSLCETYDVETEIATRDVDAFLGTLRDAGVLTMGEPGASEGGSP